MSEEQSKSKLIALENIRHQFKQDCALVFKGFVFSATPQTLLLIERDWVVDAEGFPVPFDDLDVRKLKINLINQSITARRLYFERMAQVEKDYATVEPLVEDAHEQAE